MINLVEKKETVKKMKHEVGKFQMLKRFLLIGTQGGTCYTAEANLVEKHKNNILDLLDSAPHEEILKLITECSIKARKNDYSIFVLALLMNKANNIDFSGAIQQICRTGTHYFTLVEYLNRMRGFGRKIKRGLTSWYLNKPVKDLVFQTQKYQNRNGWTHKDVIKVLHIKPVSDEMNSLFQYILEKNTLCADSENPNFKLIKGINQLQLVPKTKNKEDIAKAVEIINQYKLVREMIPTEFLNIHDVINAMLPNMGYTSIVRSLGSWTASGFFNNVSNVVNVEKILMNQEKLKFSKIHPLQLLDAYSTYSNGQGFKGKLSWTPLRRIVDLLEWAFNDSFRFVEPTNKTIMYGIDSSGSMTSLCAGSFVPMMNAAAAIALASYKKEDYTYIGSFSINFQLLNIGKSTTYKNMVDILNHFPWRTTNPSSVVKYALDHNVKVDAFIIYTDNEANCGDPISSVLGKYKKAINKDVKFITVSMSADNFSLADPNDPSMLDVIGFDMDHPSLINTFISE